MTYHFKVWDWINWLHCQNIRDLERGLVCVLYETNALNLGTQRSREKQPCFSCSWRDGVKWGNGFLYFQICRMFPLRADMALGVYVFRVLWFTWKDRYLLLMESCRGITYLLRTNNFIIVLGSEFAYESPWHITLHSFFKQWSFRGKSEKVCSLYAQGCDVFCPKPWLQGLQGSCNTPHQVQP